jgi:hypothetical protein
VCDTRSKSDPKSRTREFIPHNPKVVEAVGWPSAACTYVGHLSGFVFFVVSSEAEKNERTQWESLVGA